MNLPHLAQRLFNTPLALHPSKAEVIMASVMDRFGISKIESSLAMEDDWYGYDDNRGRESRSDPGYDNVLGVAVIPIPQFTLNWGESPQEVIDRVARWSALLYYDQPDGNLLLTRVGTRRAASGIAEGVNVEQAYYRKSMADRFSDYVGVSMSVSPIAGYSPDTAYDAVTLATARDPEAARMRYRKHISIVESTLMATQQAQSAIDWEMNRRYGRSKQLSVTIDSWRDKDGKLWEPNTLIPVDLPTLRLPKTELLLAEVTYMRDDYGTERAAGCT